ncbi:anti-sigma factor [Patulibacter minatonensis]|uniref:anti-sigma factor n=1 Tax=Patulibacter minatonensis TaxID=298163 RepID=UPI00047B4772|nr:anti-sigma factor [Patulibacter minatonensis]
MSSADAPRDLIGPFVLGACTAEEGAQVRAHMTASPEFRAEVDSFDDVYGALLDVPTPDVGPGPDLKRSIMAQVQAEASLFQAAGPDERAALVREHARAADAAEPPVATPAPAVFRGEGEPGPSPRRNAFLDALMHPARATALAAVLVALIVGGIVLGNGGGGDGSGGSSGPREYIGQFTDPAKAKQATVKMVADKDTNQLRLHGFIPAGEGKKYQVWLRSGDGDPRPTKVLFDVDGKGNATATVPGDMADVDDVLVTAEPASGSTTPTSDPVFHVQI